MCHLTHLNGFQCRLRFRFSLFLLRIFYRRLLQCDFFRWNKKICNNYNNIFLDFICKKKILFDKYKEFYEHSYWLYWKCNKVLNMTSCRYVHVRVRLVCVWMPSTFSAVLILMYSFNYTNSHFGWYDYFIIADEFAHLRSWNQRLWRVFCN